MAASEGAVSLLLTSLFLSLCTSFARCKACINYKLPFTDWDMSPHALTFDASLNWVDLCRQHTHACTHTHARTRTRYLQGWSEKQHQYEKLQKYLAVGRTIGYSTTHVLHYYSWIYLVIHPWYYHVDADYQHGSRFESENI